MFLWSSCSVSSYERIYKQWNEDDLMMLRQVQDQHVAQVIDQVDDQAQVYEGKL